MSVPNKGIRVNIYGEEYTIRSGGDDKYIREVASFLDRKMREISEKAPNKSPLKIAILAALNIADDYLKEKEFNKHGISEIEKRANDIISLMDEKLKDPV